MTQLIFLLLACCALPLFGQERFRGSENLDRVIQEAIKEERIPGAVLLVGQPGRVLHRAAYGMRSIEPSKEPMTVDTVFDVASLTKIVATTSSAMKLMAMNGSCMVAPSDRAALVAAS